MGKIVGKFVLTGGPCAGKTTALARIEEDLKELGYHVIIVSESATELIKAGIRPFGENAISMIDFQKIIVPYQLNKEQSYQEAISMLPVDEKCVIIYDRGVMDNQAYVTKEEFDEVIEPLQIGRLELLDRYDMILHLVTAADGKEAYYTLENNQARTESILEAKKMDKKAMEAWNGHNHLVIIDNTTEFEEKMQKVLDYIHQTLKEPISLRRQKNYLIDLELSNLDTISYNPIELEQFYFVSQDGYERRLRKRIQNNQATYYFTVQKKVGEGLEKVITDKKITEKEFFKIQGLYEIESIVKKIRYSFIEHKQYFKLDIFDNSLAILQVDTTLENPNIELPQQLSIIEEVTNNPNYQNCNIAKKKEKQYHL